jgi:hypothetical protein
MMRLRACQQTAGFLDKNSVIYSFRREPNIAANDLAMALHAECTALWMEGDHVEGDSAGTC